MLTYSDSFSMFVIVIIVFFAFHVCFNPESVYMIVLMLFEFSFYCVLIVLLIVSVKFIFKEGWAVSRSPRGRNFNFRTVLIKQTNLFEN